MKNPYRFNVHWSDGEDRLRMVTQIEIPSHSIVVDAIVAAIDGFNQSIEEEFKFMQFSFNRTNPQSFGMAVADDDYEAEEPGNLC